MSNCGCEVELKDQQQRSLLWILLSINGVMFVLELIAGVLADSTGLIADSLDMFADAIIYAIALYAVGRAPAIKARAAGLSGIFQIMLASIVLMDVVRRLIYGSEPESILIISIGFVALFANILCLYLISSHRQGEIHMRASWIFSKNDVLANTGVIISGLLVALSGSRLPDLIIGTIIASIVFYGGVLIIKQAREEKISIQAKEHTKH